MVHKIIPFSDRLLVKRRPIGEKVGAGGIIIAPQKVASRGTDLADVVYVPELTFADKELLNSAEEICRALVLKAREGDSDALIALLRLNEFIKLKSIKPGDSVFISKYTGTDFSDSRDGKDLTLVRDSDVIGLVITTKE